MLWTCLVDTAETWSRSKFLLQYQYFFNDLWYSNLYLDSLKQFSFLCWNALLYLKYLMLYCVFDPGCGARNVRRSRGSGWRATFFRQCFLHWTRSYLNVENNILRKIWVKNWTTVHLFKNDFYITSTKGSVVIILIHSPKAILWSAHCTVYNKK